MAYDKHTWISGETITATELNDMESGIENNSERLDELTATVNKNTTDIDGKLDKSSVTTSLTSTSDTDALAASAGKTLNDAITSLGNAVELTVMVANNQLMTVRAGQAYGVYISSTRMIVYMTIAINTTGNRSTNSGVFYLMHNGKHIRIREPYNLVCTVNDDNVLRLSTYVNSESTASIRFIATPVAWSANTQFRVTGAFLADVL